MKRIDMWDIDLSQLKKVLRNVDFFSSMNIGQMEKVLPYMVLYSFKAGEIICKQGEKGTSFFIIREGKVDVRIKKGFFSFSKRIASLGPRDFFGEISLFTEVPRTATVVCVEPSQIFMLSLEDFQYMLSQNPDFSAEIKRVVELRKFILRQQ